MPPSWCTAKAIWSAAYRSARKLRRTGERFIPQCTCAGSFGRRLDGARSWLLDRTVVELCAVGCGEGARLRHRIPEQILELVTKVLQLLPLER